MKGSMDYVEYWKVRGAIKKLEPLYTNGDFSGGGAVTLLRKQTFLNITFKKKKIGSQDEDCKLPGDFFAFCRFSFRSHSGQLSSEKVLSQNS